MYQGLSTYNDCPVKNAIVDLPVTPATQDKVVVVVGWGGGRVGVKDKLASPLNLFTDISWRNEMMITKITHHTLHVDQRDRFTQHHFVKWTNKKRCEVENIK